MDVRVLEEQIDRRESGHARRPTSEAGAPSLCMGQTPDGSGRYQALFSSPESAAHDNTLQGL